MSRPFSFASLVLLLHLAAAAAVLSQPLEPAPKAAPTALAASLHERLQELDREVRHRLERVARQENLDRTRAEDPRREAEGLRDRLGELERRLAELGDAEQADALRRKLRALGNLVGNLERASSGDAPASALPREPERRARSVPRTRIAGPVNDACASALPIALGGDASGTTVGATQDGAATCGASLSSPDVWYKYTALSYGRVSVDTFGSGYDTVVSVHSACPGSPSNELVCNDDAYGVQSATSFYGYYPGQEYWIRVSGFGGATGAFDLHLGTGGAISGTVTASTDGTPLEGGTVYAYDANGYWQGSGTTDAAGDFSVTALDASSYFLGTDGFTGYLDELYDDVPCPDSSCTVAAGTPVAVSSTGDVGGVDFALDPGGVISGRVTHAATGDPVAVADVRVEIYNSAGSQVGSALTDGSGDYELTGLASGSYYAVAESSAFVDELYDGIACPGGAPYYGCDPTTGTAITVTAPLTTAGIDFALDRLGVITGVVTEAATGDPILDVYVRVYDNDGNSFDDDYTDATGAYSIGGLPAGQYVAVTSAYDYVDEVFDDLPCTGYYYWNCDLSAGTPITVALDATVSGIDFALDRYGAISGTVTQALTGDPVLYAELTLWDADGNFIDWSYTSATGSYTFDRLSPGAYFVATDINGDFVDELYDNLPCPGGAWSGCDATTGTSIAVSLNSTTTGIDIALDPGGAIAGMVTEAATGNPIGYADVRIWDAGGDLVRSGYADGSGHYSLAGLVGGAYFVTSTWYGYVGELFDDLPCPGGNPCDPSTGTPVAVTLNATTPGIDFALDQPGAISGTITAASTGDPIDDARVEVWDAAGSLVGYTYSYSGSYTITGLAAGTYFVVAESDYYYSQFLSQLYSGVPCPGGAPAGCDPATGTPVSVSVGSTTAGIDFAVDAIGGIAGTVTDADGVPIYDARVEAWDASGAWAGYAYTYSGAFQFDGLAPGTYFLKAYSYEGHIAEVYDDLPCLDDCDPTKGTPVNVVLGTTTQVDFALDSFAITGTVTDAATGAPLVGVAIRFWAEDDYYYPGWSTTTDSSGSYRWILPPGTYYVSTDNDVGYVDEVYDGHLCSGDSYYYGGCDPTTGTLVYVGVSGHGPLAADVDFTLVDSTTIFSDGFESGNVSAWSAAVP